ncbi:MAG: lamin tail domain-containing protein, partial [Myxococcales bacterium]|nr:lamin tail domain-containing protein [Myxococcales bacterium]
RFAASSPEGDALMRWVGWTMWLVAGCGGMDPSATMPRDVDAGTPGPPPIVEHDGGDPDGGGPDGGSTYALDPSLVGLRLNELVSKNEGVAIDARGETDDYIELINLGPHSASLSQVTLSDSQNSVALPPVELAPGEHVLLWADDDPEQGAAHLGFKLSSEGEAVTLADEHGVEIDRADLPALADNEAYARHPDGTGTFAVCRYASPGRDNGRACTPPGQKGLAAQETFAPYPWPDPYPAATGVLAMTELALRPAAFIEIYNRSDTAQALADFILALGPHRPGTPLPGPLEGETVPLPAQVLQPGARVQVALDDTHTESLERDPAFEGVASLFGPDGAIVERVDFMRWPVGAALVRPPNVAHHRFCQAATPARIDHCEPLQAREVGDRLRGLRTEGDLAALAQGGTSVGIRSTKVVVDLIADARVHFLRAVDWPLHYTFVREVVEHLPRLDRCDPAEEAEFYAGWVSFSQTEYFQTEGRRFLLGTVIEYPQADVTTLEFTPGDMITGSQMTEAFHSVAKTTLQPTDLSLRPQDGRQVSRMREIEGSVPIVPTEAPFADVIMQPLTPGVAYGELRFVPASELGAQGGQTRLGPRVVVVTDDVPNDVPLVGGLITEAFQTPLAHVNVLSQARGTPNMALRGARSDARIAPLLGRLVRFEVSAGGFAIAAASAAEVDAYHAMTESHAPAVTPRLDTSVRGLQRLSDHDLDSLPAIGAKAAQLAELARLDELDMTVDFQVPKSPAAIPVIHSREHFEASGAAARLAELSRTPDFETDSRVRAAGLSEVRQRILAHPVDPTLLSEVKAHLRQHYGTDRTRFRSSSNTEDLPGFSGAGLYTSKSAALDDPRRPVADAIRTVWASLWNARAYDERALANIDQDAVAMGVLVHPAFLSERANGVAVSRNVRDPLYGDEYYVNAQIGEASVTNPAPGITTDQLIYALDGYGMGASYQSRSSLTTDPVMTHMELERLVSALRLVHDHFRPLLDPQQEERWFAMEIEFKLMGDARDLIIKQARPHNFGKGFVDLPADCREFEAR